MNITEKAKAYAEGKALNAISKAIEEAYAEGYKDGYSAGYAKSDEATPAEEFEGVNYVDLKLPSGKKWSSNYVTDEEGKCKPKLFSYDEANSHNIPTIEDFQELLKYCRMENKMDNEKRPTDRCQIVGRNGNFINIKPVRYQLGSDTHDSNYFLFWLKSNDSEGDLRKCADGNFEKNIGEIYMGYKLPIMLVK